jgi:pyruvate,orthophosphate dikinase
MHAAEGILTTRGGMTSHAAVVARGMGRPCVSGAGDIRVDYGRRHLTHARRTFKAGDIITIDGATGEVLAGAVPMIEPELSGDFATLMGWADACAAEGARQRRDARWTPHRAQIRRRGHRPVPHRAHVLRRDRIARCAR